MPTAACSTAEPTAPPFTPHVTPHVTAHFTQPAQPSVAQRIARTLALLQQHLPSQRRMVHAGDAIARAGDRLDCLYVIHSGMVKTVNCSADGREQVVGLHFKGDWLGLDAIAEGRHGCDAIAMDVGEVWAIPYAALLQACSAEPALLGALHAAMSREIARDRDSMMSLCTLPAEARVAEFLRAWAEALAERGLRTDQITLRMTRAEIGNYLGMTLETVSRSLSRLARDKIIGFMEKDRRDVRIPDLAALSNFVRLSLARNTAAPATA